MNQGTKLKFKELKKLLSFNRLQILELLLNGETCVCEMVNKTGLEHNLVSHHLKVLNNLGYVDSNKQGLHVLYSLKQDRFQNINNLFNFITTNYEN